MREGDHVDGRYRLQGGPLPGGRSEVWLAYDTELGQQVALKRVRIDGDGDGAFDRLRSEARALAKFREHPHVVTLFDAVRVNEAGTTECWLVMEYAAGGSLSGRPPMSPREAARIGAHIARALTALHASGIVHCDVKPGNIVLTTEGTAKLTDLDAAYRVAGEETITPNRGVSYTPDYAAPEVVRGNPVRASDVFSLGATLYELIAGRPPRDLETWHGDSEDDLPGQPDAHSSSARPDEETASETWLQRLRYQRGAAVRIEGDAGPLGEVLQSMLAHQPRQRPTADQVRQRFEEVAGIATPPPATPAAAPAPGGSGSGKLTGITVPIRRHPRLVALSALSVAAALVIAWAAQGRGDNPSDSALPSSSPRPTVPSADDPRAADPCALASPAALSRFGESQLDDDYGNFDRCDILVDHADNSEVDVKVDLSNNPPPDIARPARTVGRVGIVEVPSEDDECTRTLVPGGTSDFTVRITAHQIDEGPAPLCEMADAAATHAGKVLDKGPIPRRAVQPAADSLARLDACSLLDAKTLATVPGIDAGDPDVGYGNWECEWHSTTSNTVAELRFDRGQARIEPTARRTRLSDRPAYVEPEGDGSDTCRVRVEHREYSDHSGRRGMEAMYVTLRGRQPVAELCTMATGLATSAAAELPQPLG